jgi:hypothetical protein|tara:strand:+ start:705 stop:1094 length:390 start_codon:yes stop_codon:yes gene_type:complete
MDIMTRFDVALSLQLGMPLSTMKETLTNREYEAYFEYYQRFGIGKEAEFVMSANQIITIANYITGAMGGKPTNLTPEDIYPQLSYSTKKKRGGNNAVDWDSIDDQLRAEFVEAGLFTEDGEPVNQNPHR